MSARSSSASNLSKLTARTHELSAAWIKAYDAQQLAVPEAIDDVRRKRAAALRAQAATSAKYLEQESDEKEEGLETLSSAFVDACDAVSTAAEEEEKAWAKYITEGGDVEEFIKSFIAQNAAYGLQPCPLTDLTVASMMEKLAENAPAREAVASLLSFRRDAQRELQNA